MAKHLLLAIALLTAAVLVAPASSPAADGGKTIVFALGSDPISLDPPNQTDNPSEIVVRHIHDNLVEFNEKLEITPQLATGWDVSADGLTWTFKLRQGVKFHDGSPFDAQAVVATFKRNLDPKNRTQRTSLYEPFVAEVVAVDAHTVAFKLKEPFGALLSHLAHGAGGIVSPKALEKHGDKLGLNPVGTGLFSFVEWAPGDRVVLKRNDNYWKDKAKVEKLVFKPVPEAAARVIMLETGEADVVYPVPEVEVERLGKLKNVKVLTSHTNRAMYIGLNTAKKPFADVRVRQALNHGVDKEAIVKTIMKGMATPSKSMLAALTWGSAEVGFYKYDPEKAKKLLAEAGLPNGFEANLWTPEGRYAMDIQICEAVAGQLKKIGVNVKIRKMEWAAFLRALRKAPQESTHEMYFLGWSTSTGDADWGLRPMFHSGNFPPDGGNRCYYKNDEVDRLLNLGMKTSDQAKRKEAYAKAQQILFNEAAWLMLHDMDQSVGVARSLEGVTIWPIEIVLVKEAHFK